MQQDPQPLAPLEWGAITGGFPPTYLVHPQPEVLVTSSCSSTQLVWAHHQETLHIGTQKAIAAHEVMQSAATEPE
jgi:hypothetical protein